VVYCVLNTVIQSVIQPRFIGDAVGLSVTVTFVVLFFWSWLLGQPGERDQLQTHVVERLPSTAGNARITRSLRHPRGSREATVYCLRTWSPCRQPIRSASAASCCGAGSASAAWAGCLSGRLRRASRRLSRSSGRSSPTIRSSGNGSVARSRHAVLTDGPLSPPAQHRLARELAEALSAIHAAGLVHRDLKPANVLLSPAGARVIDFGIAKAMDSTRLTSTGMIIGTPGYMAPEQVTDPNGSGPAADVFAVGATLVFAATGNSPFGAGQVASTLYRVVNLEPDLRGVPPDTARIARACLAKDPAQRPTSAALAAALRGGPSGTIALTAPTMNLTGPQPTATAALPHPGPGPLRPDRRRARGRSAWRGWSSRSPPPA
jgi:hypothetical protein